MCGIWFSVGFAPDPARIDAVSHRGPDGRGWQVFDTAAGPVALGHRRLSIIDLSEAASQPMSYAEDRFWITYNGEIYNYLELRAELAELGHRFRTQSDTEVLLAAYAEWGEAALDRLIGMFAFVVWDCRTHTIFAARDPFGVKPLYFFATPTGLSFASEIKQFIGLAPFTARLNLARAYDFLSAGVMDHTAETMFAGIRQLRGGEYVRLPLDHWHIGEALPVRRWYGISEPGTLDIPEAEAAHRFGELLDESVRFHLRSDVPVGSCLSGGLDSSSIVCLMARHLEVQGSNARVHSVSACYDVKAVDERPFMEAVVEQAATTPHWCYPRAEDAIAKAEEITWHQDEPYGSTSIFAQWCVFAAAREAGLKVMLDGQGADEQLAGYHGSFSYHFAMLIRQLRWASLVRAAFERRAWHGVSVPGQACACLVPLLPPRVAGWLRRERQIWCRRDWLNSDAFRPYRHQNAFEIARQSLGRPPIGGIGDLCVLLTHSLNLATLLHWEDRNSMAHGIEARVPFLDRRLVEFSLALGDTHKIVGADTKRVLRRAMQGILPERVRSRRDKLGFATPEESWFRGPLREAVNGGIEDTLARYPGLLNASAARAHAADMLDGRRPLDFSLWRIANLGLWGRIFAVSV